MKLWKIILITLISSFLSVQSYAAGSLDAGTLNAGALNAVPPELKQWVPWVKKDLDFLNCPMTDGAHVLSKQSRICAWPDTLVIDINRTVGKFEQNWKVYREGWVPLPGDKYNWPALVQVNGQDTKVRSYNERPEIFLREGVAKVTGYWKWDSQPEEIAIPELSGRLQLSFNLNPIAFPNIEQGKLWLGEQEQNEVESDSVFVQVFRKIHDGHPIIAETQVNLNVAGRARSINLGAALLDGFQLMGTTGDIPAIVNEKSELVIQARPGDWTIRVFSFIRTSASEFKRVTPSAQWPAQEVWSYQSNDTHRVTALEGLALIDPETASVPYQWKSLPSFLVEPDSVATLVEKFRGVAGGESNRLNLNRELWYNFAQDGWRFEDQLSGQMRSDWRINLDSPFQLQKASEQGEGLLITELAEQKSGVELRLANVSVQAGGVVSDTTSLPIIGWDQSMESVSWYVNLPPAHKLLFASGAPQSNAWFEQWDLWNLFWLMLISVVAWKNINPLVGMITFVTLILIFHEVSAPVSVFSNLILATALFINLPSNVKWMDVVRKGYLALSVFLFLIVGGEFLVNQVRVMIHPQLEFASPTAQNIARKFSSYDEPQAVLSSPAVMEQERVAKVKQHAEEMSEKITITGSRIKKSDVIGRFQSDAVLQAGSGTPQWRWNQYSLNWQGPVLMEQQVSLWIIKPWQRTLWQLGFMLGLMVVFAAVVLVVIQRLGNDSLIQALATHQWGKQLSKWLGSSAALLLMTFAMISPNTEATGKDLSGIPPADILNELQNWVVKNPKCTPNCLSVVGIDVKAESNRLTLAMKVDAFESAALALPYSAHWSIQSAMVDGQNQSWLARKSGKTYIAITKGSHKVVLTGPLAPVHNLSLVFPVPVYGINNVSDAWEMEGVKNGALMDGSLGLIRRQSQTNGTASIAAQPVEQVKPMVRIQREFVFAEDWYLVNQVNRLAPFNGAINLKLPLYDWEQVYMNSQAVEGKTITVQIPSGDESTRWESMVPKFEQLDLLALDNSQFVEEWVFSVSHQWHIELNGIPAIWPSHFDGDDIWQFRYLPREGEQLTLKAERPTAIKGSQLAFNKLDLNVTVGQQQESIRLSANYKSTRGGPGQIHVGKGEHLQATLDGRSSPLQIQNGVIDYPIAPGEHSVDLNWKRLSEIQFKTVLAPINVNADVTNLSVTWNWGAKRWVVWTSGPVIGPAIIYWGEFLAFLVIALVLWKTNLLPISPVHWLLLGLGLSLLSWWLLVVTTIWLMALDYQSKQGQHQSRNTFNAIQALLVMTTVGVLLSLIGTVPFSLYSQPDMGIMGNYSNGSQLRWYLDATTGAVPDITVYSLPMWVYKLLMLVWALWLASRLVSWSKWSWQSLTANGFWRAEPKKSIKPKVEEHQE